MRETNEAARRAYQVVHNIVGAKDLVNPLLWRDIEGFFCDQTSPQMEVQFEHQYAAEYGYYNLSSK